MNLIPYLEKAGKPARGQLAVAYEEFLVEFPLCYGYWHRLAKLQRDLAGDEAAIAIYERGIDAVNCVELYISYCTFMSSLAGPSSQELHFPSSPHMLHAAAHAVADEACSIGEARARALFERAVGDQGRDWNAEKLWSLYITFEQASALYTLQHDPQTQNPEP
jgi:hypothetical protein